MLEGRELKEVFRANLRRLLNERGATQRELADHLGVSAPTVNDWLNGRKTPRMDKLDRICAFFGVQRSELMAIDVSLRGDTTRDVKQPGKYIPIVGAIRCGPGGAAYEDITEYISTDCRYPKDEMIALRVLGDSMEGHSRDAIFAGDTVIIHLQDIVSPGDIAAVLVDGEEGMIKRIRYDAPPSSYISLESINEAYPPRIFTGEDMRKIHIIGRVVRIMHDR